MNHPTRIRPPRLAFAAGAVFVLLALAGCSTGSTASESAPTSTPSPREDRQQPSGVSGLIAAAQDGQLQVRSAEAQTAVRYTADTTVRSTVSGTVADLRAGDCVIAMGEEGDAVTRITVTVAVDGECGMAGVPGGGAARDGAGGTPPNGVRPTDMPTDAPDGGSRPGGSGGGFPGGSITVGKVTAVTTGAITVDAVGQSGSREDTTPTATSTELTVSADTVVSRTVDGTTGDISEGLCVTAQGEADDAGGYDATALTLSQPAEDGTCSTGRGGFGTPPSGNGDAADD